jgi:hypothetical protein
MKTLIKPTRGRSKAAKCLKITLSTLILLAGVSAAHADYCRTYSGEYSIGTATSFYLPAVVATSNPNWWGSSSIRRSANGLTEGGAVYENVESIRIVASNSAVAFYAYSGDYMDGDVQVIRCGKGGVCTWTYGWMKNNLRSFVCQREPGAPELPTAPLGDGIAEELHAEIEASSKINDSPLRYGRIWWTNALSRCEREGICNDLPNPGYNDLLEFNYQAELDINNWVPHKDAWIDFWLHPQVFGGNDELRFDETY